MSHHAPIDVHAHYFPQSFLDLVAKHGPGHGFEYKIVEGKGPQFKHGHLMTGPVGAKFVDLDARLAAMDEQGVEVHALSLSQPMGYWADGELAKCISETYNDALARAHERHPKRLVGLATLPMHEPALAARSTSFTASAPRSCRACAASILPPRFAEKTCQTLHSRLSMSASRRAACRFFCIR